MPQNYLVMYYKTKKMSFNFLSAAFNHVNRQHSNGLEHMLGTAMCILQQMLKLDCIAKDPHLKMHHMASK